MHFHPGVKSPFFPARCSQAICVIFRARGPEGGKEKQSLEKHSCFLILKMLSCLEKRQTRRWNSRRHSSPATISVSVHFLLCAFELSVLNVCSCFLRSGTSLHHHQHCLQAVPERHLLQRREHHVPPQTRHHHPQHARGHHHLLHGHHRELTSTLPATYQIGLQEVTLVVTRTTVSSAAWTFL